MQIGDKIQYRVTGTKTFRTGIFIKPLHQRLRSLEMNGEPKVRTLYVVKDEETGEEHTCRKSRIGRRLVLTKD